MYTDLWIREIYIKGHTEQLNKILYVILAMQSSLFSISSPLPIGVIRGCKNCEGCQKVRTFFCDLICCSFRLCLSINLVSLKVSARWRPEAGCRPVLEDAPVFFPLDEVSVSLLCSSSMV